MLVILLVAVPVTVVILFGISATVQYFWRERNTPSPPSLGWSHCPDTPSERPVYISLSREIFPTETFVAGAVGTTIATITETGIRLQDLLDNTNDQIVPLPPDAGEPSRVVLQPALDRLLVETRTPNFDVNLLALTVPDGEVLWRENAVGQGPRVLFFTPNEDIIGYDGFERITFVDIAQGTVVQEISVPSGVLHTAFSDTGLFLLRNAGFNDMSGSRRLYVWDTCTGDLLRNAVGSFSGNNFTLQGEHVVGYSRGIVNVTDGRTSEQLRRIDIEEIDDSPFNELVSNRSGTLFVLERSDHIDVFHANFNRIERLAFSSAAARLLSIADDGAMLLEVEYFPDNNALVPQTASREVILLRASR